MHSYHILSKGCVVDDIQGQLSCVDKKIERLVQLGVNEFFMCPSICHVDDLGGKTSHLVLRGVKDSKLWTF